MSFGEDLRLFADKAVRRNRQVFVGTVTGIHGSITRGSALTGAPGQPVDTSYLLNSWTETFPDEWIGEVSTNTVYAPAIEEGRQAAYVRQDGTWVDPRPMELRSSVGGFHSVALTRASFDRIVADEALKARALA